MPKLRVPFQPLLLFFIVFTYAKGLEFNTTLSDAFPQLVGISNNPATGLGLSLGGQDFEHCCNVAVYESLDIEDGMVRGLRSPSFIGSDLSAFQRRQYPCGAEYIGQSQSSFCFQTELPVGYSS